MHLDLWSINHRPVTLAVTHGGRSSPRTDPSRNPVIAKFSRYEREERIFDSHCPQWRCIIPQYKTLHPQPRDNAFKMMPAFFPPLVKNDPKSKSLIFADSHCWLRVISPYSQYAISDAPFVKVRPAECFLPFFPELALIGLYPVSIIVEMTLRNERKIPFVVYYQVMAYNWINHF